MGRVGRVRCKSRKRVGKMFVSVVVGGLFVLAKWSAYVLGCFFSYYVILVILSSGGEVYGTVLIRFGFVWSLFRGGEVEGLLFLRF